MHDGYKKLIGFLNFIKHCDWFNLCQKSQFQKKISKNERKMWTRLIYVKNINSQRKYQEMKKRCGHF